MKKSPQERLAEWVRSIEGLDVGVASVLIAGAHKLRTDDAEKILRHVKRRRKKSTE